MKDKLVNSPFIRTFLYSLIMAFILLAADKTFSYFNEYFLYIFKTKELLKNFFIILLISFIASSKVRLSILATLLLFSLLQYIHFQFFGKNITGVKFYLFLTNIGETFETLNEMLTITIVPLVITIAAFILVLFIDKLLNERLYHINYASHLLILVITILISQVVYVTHIRTGKISTSQTKLIYPVMNRHSSRNFFVALNYFLAGIVPQKIYGKDSQFPILASPDIVNTGLNRNIVLIIGESLRADRLALDNNHLTPRLQTMKGDERFYYNSIFSSGTMTKVSVAAMINRVQYPGLTTQIAQEDNCIFKLAKNNNFNTYFISAQNKQQLQIIRDVICPKYIDTFIERESFPNHIESTTGYDEDILSVLKTIDFRGSNLIVLQQRGSHTPFEKQYPQQFDKYNPYDNTALYTDHNLFQMLSYVKESSSNPAYLFYTSDHGELLGENGKNGHGHMEREVYQVPFVFYASQDLPFELKNKVSHITNHFDISNLITSLLGYKTDVELTDEREFYILNSDLDGFSGYAIMKTIKGIEQEVRMINVH